MEYGLDYLRGKLDKHAARVNLRYKQYDEKYQDKDVGIVIPKEMKDKYRAVMGWTAKSVDALADRLVFKGFVNDNFNIEDIFNMNNPDIFFDNAILSTLIGSCCFVYISKAETGEARLQIIEASNATGIIDPITGLLNEGYAILSRDKYDYPNSEVYFRPYFTDYYEDGKFAYRINNPTGRVLLVPIMYRPDAKRPFGRSRIKRSVMYYQAYAKRTLERADISAEFYSFPQKYMLGTSQDAEPMDKFQATIATILEVTKDEDGDIPKLGQFQQQSMAPFTEQLKTLASVFAGETGLTLDDLGFATDNPSSADAIKASHETLRAIARKAQRCFNSGFLNVGYVARCLEDDYPYLRNQFYKTKTTWYPIFEPDVAALSGIGDAAIKVNQAVPDYFNKNNLSDLTGIDYE